MTEAIKSLTMKNKVIYWIKTLFCLWLLFGFGYLKPWGTLEPIGMNFFRYVVRLDIYWLYLAKYTWRYRFGLQRLRYSEQCH